MINPELQRAMKGFWNTKKSAKWSQKGLHENQNGEVKGDLESWASPVTALHMSRERATMWCCWQTSLLTSPVCSQTCSPSSLPASRLLLRVLSRLFSASCRRSVLHSPFLKYGLFIFTSLTRRPSLVMGSIHSFSSALPPPAPGPWHRTHDPSHNLSPGRP